MMYSTSTATLLFSGVLFALLHNTHCLSVGQRCDILAEVDECDPGLTCTGVVSDAYCESECCQVCLHTLANSAVIYYYLFRAFS